VVLVEIVSWEGESSICWLWWDSVEGEGRHRRWWWRCLLFLDNDLDRRLFTWLPGAVRGGGWAARLLAHHQGKLIRGAPAAALARFISLMVMIRHDLNKSSTCQSLYLRLRLSCFFLLSRLHCRLRLLRQVAWWDSQVLLRLFTLRGLLALLRWLRRLWRCFKDGSQLVLKGRKTTWLIFWFWCVFPSHQGLNLHAQWCLSEWLRVRYYLLRHREGFSRWQSGRLRCWLVLEQDLQRVEQVRQGRGGNTSCLGLGNRARWCTNSRLCGRGLVNSEEARLSMVSELTIWNRTGRGRCQQWTLGRMVLLVLMLQVGQLQLED